MSAAAGSLVRPGAIGTIIRVAFIWPCTRRCLARCLGALLLVVSMVAGGTVAYAHAALLEATPANGVVLSALPEQAQLTFDEPVSPLFFHLILPDGKTQALTHVQSINNGLRIGLPAQHMPGTYALSWRVISADGHPVGGAVVFSLGTASAAPAVADEVVPPLRDPIIWLSKLALYVGLMFGVGGALSRAFLAWTVHRRGAAYHARHGIWLGLVAVPVSLALQGLDALNAPWGFVVRAQVWQSAIHTTYFYALVLDALALLVAWFALAAAGRGQVRVAAVLAVLLLGASFAVSGHASTASPQWLARPAVWLHTMAVAAWLGSLIPLWWLARRNDAQLAPALRRFSRHILWVVAVLLASGVGLVLLQFDAVSSLWRTAYGQVYLAKMAFVATLLLVAAWNRYRLTAGVVAGEEAPRRALSRLIRVEVVLAVCVLAIVALWRFTPPPRAVDMSASAIVSTTLHNATASVRLEFKPVGANQPGTLLLTLADAKSAPLKAVAVNVSFLDPASSVEPLRRDAKQVGPGQWEVSSLLLPRVPRWTVRVDVFVSDFDRVRLEGNLAMFAPTTGGSHMHG